MQMTGEIRLLKWGIIPKLPYWQVSVGQRVVLNKIPVVISKISREVVPDVPDEFHVICSALDDRGNINEEVAPFIWKTYNLTPDEIQYFAPDEKHDYILV